MAFPSVVLMSILYLASSVVPTRASPLERRADSCKPRSGDAAWPDSAAWSRLKDDVGGRLFVPTPLAAACYNGAAPGARATTVDCNTVTGSFNSSILHAQDPTSMQAPNWEDDACIPPQLLNNTGAPPKCDANAFPRYVVEAADANDVATAVKFAAKTDVRLVVRATGHDYLGRSNAPDSLSIWTHNLKDIAVHDAFAPKKCAQVKAVPAVTMGAGWQWGDVYKYLWARNISAVGGSDFDVGIMGWVTGGGHSPVSNKYGLGVDNVLEMEVVTPAGDIVIANACENPDLFWAMRGGGGSTFGVATSMTMTTQPDEPASIITVIFQSTTSEAATNNNTKFYEAAAFFCGQLLALNEAGIAGYWQVAPANFPGWGTGPQGGAHDPRAILSAYFYALSVSVDDVNKALAPVGDYLSRVGNGTLTYNISVTASPSFSAYHNTFVPLPGGSNLLLPSRLLDAAALKSPLLPSVLRTVVDQSAGGLQGLLVSGPGVRSVAPDSAAANPAWRRTVSDVSTSATYPLGGSPEQVAQGRAMVVDVLQPALSSLAPDTGVYLNENTPYNPDWQSDFWGPHYPRLKAFKDKTDPKGVFYCPVCVGSEEWTLDASGKLCRN